MAPWPPEPPVSVRKRTNRGEGRSENWQNREEGGEKMRRKTKKGGKWGKRRKSKLEKVDSDLKV